MALDHITYELLHSRMLAWHAEEMRCAYVDLASVFFSFLVTQLIVFEGLKTSSLCRQECTILLEASKTTPTTRSF